MPTLEHNAIVEMFRETPELAPHLLATLFHVDVPAHSTTRVGESALDQLVPVEFRGPMGLAVVQVALVALGRLDREHAAVYFQIIWKVLREPMQRTLEAMVMERQTDGRTPFPPFVEKIFEQGVREGTLSSGRATLLRLMTRAGLTLTEEHRARIQACSDPQILDQWIENVLGATTTADVLG